MNPLEHTHLDTFCSRSLRSRVVSAFIALMVAASLCWGAFARAQTLTPIRGIDETGVSSQLTPMTRVTSARILIADYGLIQQDFPITRGWSQEKIDAWILENTGYLAQTQIENGSGVNSPVPTDGRTRQAHRPEGYGRGIVYEIRAESGQSVGLMDAKGTGAIRPAQKSHSSGLMSTGEGLREFFYEKYISGVLEHSRSDWATVGTYAVVDWGFDELHPDGSKVPAGSVLRQAHRRVEGNPGFQYLPAKDARSLELNLREFGLTSTGDSVVTHGVPATNLQGTPDRKLVDFGQIIALPEFPPAPGVGNYGETALTILIQPGDADFVAAPRENMRGVSREWGPREGQKPDPKFDRISGEMHDLAQGVRDGRLSRRDVVQAYRQKVEGALTEVRKTPPETLTVRTDRHREGSYQAARRYLAQGGSLTTVRGLDLALAKGVSWEKHGESLVDGIDPFFFSGLSREIAKRGRAEELELAIALAKRQETTNTWVFAGQYVSKLPPSPQRSKLVQLLANHADAQTRRVLLLTGLAEDAGEDARAALQGALSSQRALGFYSHEDLRNELQRTKIWSTLDPESRELALQISRTGDRAEREQLLSQLSSRLSKISDAQQCARILSDQLQALQQTAL